MINNPITPSNFICDPRYQAEMVKNKPQPRIRMENKWIRDVSEQGSVGILFKLQGIESRLEEMRILDRERRIKSNNGEICHKTKTSELATDTILRQESLKKKVDLHKKRKQNKIHNKSTKDHYESNDNYRKFIKSSESFGEKRKEILNSKSPIIVNSSGGRDYLRAHQISGPPLDVDDYPPIKKLDLTNPKTVRVSVPTAKSATQVKPKRRDIDFVKANAFAIDIGWYRNNLKKSTMVGESENSALKAVESPVKSRQLSSLEIKQMLTKLNNDRNHWYGELSRLPISMDTLRTKSRQKQIEDRISEIDHSIDLFSSNTVFLEQ